LSGAPSVISDGDEVLIDLEKSVVTTVGGKELRSKPLPREVIEIIEAGGLIEKLKKGARL
jgi:3-isopropylmalate dehydratase small subunit